MHPWEYHAERATAEDVLGNAQERLDVSVIQILPQKRFAAKVRPELVLLGL